MSGIITNIAIIVVSVVLPPLIGAALRKVFFKPHPPKGDGEKKKSPVFFDTADFTSKKENPYEEK